MPKTQTSAEFINGEITQKPIPEGKLYTTINQVAEPEKIAYAFPELRCTFGGESIVPDVVVCP